MLELNGNANMTSTINGHFDLEVVNIVLAFNFYIEGNNHHFLDSPSYSTF